MYWDHDFESDTEPGTSIGRCAVAMYRRDGSEYKCNAESSSVLHRPDQFRHWCANLEAGADCMCFEDRD